MGSFKGFPVKEKLALVVGVVVLLAFIVLATQENGGGGFLGASGLTITSVDQTEIFSPSQNLKGQWWLVNTLIGGGQSIIGTLTPEQTTSLCHGADCEYSSEFPLEIKVDANNELINYEVRNQYEPVYDYYFEQKACNREYTWYGTSYCASMPSCSSNDLFMIIHTYEPGYVNNGWQEDGELSTHRYCLYRTLIGDKGYLDSPNVEFTSQIRLTANGDSYNEEINSNTQSTVDFIGTDGTIASASWIGSLVTGDSPPTEAYWTPIYSVALGQKWHVISSDRWDKYQRTERDTISELNSIKSRCFNSYSVGNECPNAATEITNAIAPTRSDATSVMNSRDPIDSSQVINYLNDRQAQDTSVSITLPARVINIPNVLFRIRADFIGIKQEVGNPKIRSVDSQCTNSGEPMSVIVEVENAADFQSTFVISMIPCGVFKQKYSSISNQHSLPAWGRDDYVFGVSYGDAADDITKTCEICVTEKGDTSLKHCADVELCLKKPATCSPGRYYLDLNLQGSTCISQCIDTGGQNFEVVRQEQTGQYADSEGCCVLGVDFVNGEYVCNTGGIIPPPPPPPIDYWIFALIGFGLGFVGGMKLLRKSEGYVPNKPFYRKTWFIGSLILGLILAVVFYMIAPTILQVIDVAIPTFDCPGALGVPDIGCIVMDFILLFIWIIFFIILIKFVI